MRTRPDAQPRAKGRRDARSLRSSTCYAPITAWIAGWAAAASPSDYDAGRALHAGLGRARDRRAARPYHPCRARVRDQCREDQRPLHGDPRRRGEPLVPHGHDLSGDHQSPGAMRLRRPIGRRLVALCRAGETAAADRLAAGRLRAGLEPTAAADERHIVLLCAHRSVALRDAESRRKSCRRRRRTATGPDR